VTQPAILALEDGTVFEGDSVGAPGLAVGEVVFNTAMTGYQEILTDPSYARQLVTLTYPHIGNTGCNAADDESRQAWAAGLIVRDVPRRPSSWRNEVALPQWLRERGVVAISGIDTRRLTRLLRDPGRPGAQAAIARIHIGLGNPDEALDRLEAAVREHDPMFASEPLLTPIFDPLRQHPRFARLVRGIGLSERVLR